MFYLHSLTLPHLGPRKEVDNEKNRTCVMWYYKSQSTVKVMSLILKWLLNVVRNRLTHFLIGIMTFTWVKSRSTCFVTLPNKDSFGSCAVSSVFGTGLHVSLKIMPNLSFDTWFYFWSRFSHFPWKENQKQSPIIEPLLHMLPHWRWNATARAQNNFTAFWFPE